MDLKIMAEERQAKIARLFGAIPPDHAVAEPSPVNDLICFERPHPRAFDAILMQATQSNEPTVSWCFTVTVSKRPESWTFRATRSTSLLRTTDKFFFCG